ncbi:uncharacterized protein N7496_000959 [Penicillium cataractarum]|uniref:DUF7730 domain-containing protein n=1 Tax=Penicillium cataractarum TaxID=2100454 RepID=A0A9W9VV34_9EURO|nr:uncharacterized protein N7496_000959 [Penicillium cataractarum]KAJ5389891.1 hypothetical protein N7496_000959 [Penicillium cataractarum]
MNIHCLYTPYNLQTYNLNILHPNQKANRQFQPDNKPPPLPHPRHDSPHTPQPQPQCALLTRLSPELRLIIWEMALGGRRLHIIQHSGQRLGHVICPLGHDHSASTGSGTGPGAESGSRPRLDSYNKLARGTGQPFCEICHGAGVAQPVKEGDSWGVGCDGLLGLVLTCRQIFSESIHLLYATNTFEFSIPWSLPYLQPTIPSEYWECIRAVELRWSFPGHWLPTKDPVRAIYVSAGRAQWLETCRSLKQLPALRSFVLVLGSSWFSEPVEKLPVFLEPLCGLHVIQGKRKTALVREKVDMGMDLMDWRKGSGSSSSSDEEMSSRVSFESSSSSRLTGSSASSLRSEGSACSFFDSGLTRLMDSKDDTDRDVDTDLATWELRLQGQSYYSHEVGQIGDDLWRRGVDCWISTV